MTPEEMRDVARDLHEKLAGASTDQGALFMGLSVHLWGASAEICERLDAIAARLEHNKGE